MSQKISMIIDVLRNEPHVLILDEGSGIAVKAITEFGKSLVDGVIFLDQETGSRVIINTLPPGFEATEFKNLSQKTKSLFDSVFVDDVFGEKTIKHILDGKINNKTLIQRKNHTNNWVKTGSRTPSEQSLDRFRTSGEKINMVAYKARLFKSTTKKSEIVSALKAHSIGFNDRTNNFASRGSTDISEYIKTKASIHAGMGNIRRFLSNQSKSEIKLSTPNRRVTRRVLLISSEDIVNPKTKANNRFILAIKSRFKKIDGKNYEK